MSKITIYSPPATAQIKACAVDFDLRRAPVPVHLVQYDKTIPILAVSLYKGGSPYTLPADAEVNVRMNKRNNLCVYNPALGCNESRDVVYVAVTPQMTTQDGTFEPILEVVINSGVAGTSPMQLVIRRNPVQEDAIEDTSEAKTLTELVSQAAASATAAAQSASAAAEDAGKAAASATAAAESDEHATATAQNIKDSLDQIASNAAAVSQLKEATDALKDGKISKFYASSQGDTNLPDSDDGRIVDLKLYGKSEQKQYTGKNLLKCTLATETKLGVTCTNNRDGTYTVNGTPDAGNNVYFSINNNFTAKAGIKYKLLGCPKGGNMDTGFAMFFRENFRVDSGGGATFKYDEDKTNYISIKIANGCTAKNLIFKPMIVDADTYPSATYDDFEPYVGGIPSPNPEYPQEIKSVVKPVVKVCGKNLLKTINWETQTVSGVTIEKTSDTVFKISGTATDDEVVFNSSWGQGINVPAQSYLLCKILHGSCPAGSGVIFFTANYSSISSEIGGLSRMQGSPITCGLVRFFIKKGSNINCTVGLSIQMDTSTDYEPYTEQTVTLPYTLNAIPVTSGGNVTIDGQQYIADYVDVEKGKLVRMVHEVSLTDTLSFAYESKTSSGYYRYNISESVPDNQKYNANLFPPNSFEVWGQKSKALCAGFGNIIDSDSSNFKVPENLMGIFIDGSRGVVFQSTHEIEELKTKFPMQLLYALKTPTETDLAADEIAAFKALVSYYPVTNVSTTSDQLDGYTVFDYPISLANGWNYVKQQLGDARDYLYGIDLMTAEAYVNSEYAAALAEIEV